jgi:hypothetical protein
LFTNFFNLIHVFMKKGLFFAAIAAIAMTGCSSDETIEQQTLEAQSPAIGFRTVANSGTRATEMDGANITNFQVSALYSDNQTDGTSDAATLMDKVVVTRDLNASTYSYAPAKYFPVDGEPVDFYAFSPAGSRNLTTVTPANTPNTDATSTDGVTSIAFAYEVPTGAGAEKNQEDFLVASKLQVVGTTNPTEVLLGFDHALSKVTFSAKNVAEGTTVNITGLKLVNLGNSATLTMSYADAVPAPTKAGYVWSAPVNTTQTYVASVPTTGFSLVGASNPSPSILSTDNEGLMVLPQVLAAWTGSAGDAFASATDPYVEVTYGMKDASGEYIYPANSVARIPLSGAIDDDTNGLTDGKRTLDIGVSYNLQFTFGAAAGDGGGEGGGEGGDGDGDGDGDGGTPGGVNAISFDVTVGTWGSDDIEL